MPLDLSVVGKPFNPTTFEYSDREVMLYALGIGAGTGELEFTYEKNLKVYPTFAVIPAFAALASLGQVLTFNWAMLLHGEQRIELKGLIPPSGKLTTVGIIRASAPRGSPDELQARQILLAQLRADPDPVLGALQAIAVL